MTRKIDSIRMSVAALALDVATQNPLVILTGSRNTLILPISIGQLEAIGMAMEIDGQVHPRPTSHTLLNNVLQQTEASLEYVEITRVDDEVFYALLHLSFENRAIAIDCRPSDALILAVKNHTAIYVAKDVVEAYAINVEDDIDPGNPHALQPLSNDPLSKDRLTALLDQMSPEDFKYKI